MLWGGLLALVVALVNVLPDGAQDPRGGPVEVRISTVSADSEDGWTTFSWTVMTNRPVSFEHLQLATAGLPGAGFHSGVVVDGTRTFTATQELPPGEHVTHVAYSMPGGPWVNGPATRHRAEAVVDSEKPLEPAPTRAEDVPLALPEKVVGGYWLKWAESGSGRLADVDPRYNTVLLAFARGREGTGAVSFDQGVQSSDSFRQDVQTLRGRGQRVVLSIGGAGGFVDVGSERRREEFLGSVLALRSNFSFDGLDWDVEGQELHVDNMVWVSQQLKERFGKDFSIMLAPQIHVGAYDDLAQQLGDDLDFTGIQFYDYPEPSQEARIDRVLDRVAGLTERGVDPSRIGIGMRVYDASRSYTEDGIETNWFSLAGSKQAWDRLEGAYPTLRGAYQWEIATDRTLGGRWIAEVGAAIP